MNGLKDSTVLVLGLGESGLAMARWCARFGATVRVWDSRPEPPHAAALAASVPAAQCLLGALTETRIDAALAGVTRVLKSPGLAPLDARISALLASAVAHGVPVQGELDLFAQALRELRTERGYAPKVLAITGTNGKTTTTAMTALLVERAGKRVAVAGNIGPTLLQTLADALDLEPLTTPLVTAAEPLDTDVAEARVDDAATEGADASEGTDASEASDASEADALCAPADDAAAALVIAPTAPPAPVFLHLPEVWVLELSSFQLDGVQGFEPSAAAVLNITQDHLDWHGSMAHYAAAKARIFGATAVLVVNRDDAGVERLIPAPQVIKGTNVAKGAKGRRAVAHARAVVRFGLGAPQRPGDFGIVEENGMAWLVRARELDETLQRGRGGKGLGQDARDSEELLIQRLMPADALRVRGRHNAANALAALALATAIDCALAPMLHGLREYRGEPHRVQYLATIDAVDAFDDSKGTNVGATVAALHGLGADKAPGRLVIILGGDGKGQDFAPLAEPVRRHARAVALIGRDAARIEAALADCGVPMQRHASLEAATRWCFERAHAGDAVLLSPACASLDMFRDYAHRAAVFVAEVHGVIADRGGVAA